MPVAGRAIEVWVRRPPTEHYGMKCENYRLKFIPDGRRFFQAPGEVVFFKGLFTCFEEYGIRFETNPGVPRDTVLAYKPKDWR